MSKKKTALQPSYTWKNSEFKVVPPEIAASELARIKDERGSLKAGDVVEEAADPSSPLHALFPWDDSEAARIGRESIAARIIRSIKVTIVTTAKEPIVTRAFISTRDANAKGSRTYDLTTSALESEEGRAFLIRQAWMQLHAWRKRYSQLAELAEVFDAIDRVEAARSA
jgi:hypothetical protein